MADEEKIEQAEPSNNVSPTEEEKPGVEVVVAEDAAEGDKKIDEPPNEGAGEEVATSVQDDHLAPIEDTKEVPKELMEQDTKELPKEQIEQDTQELPKEQNEQDTKELPKEQIEQDNKELPKEQIEQDTEQLPEEQIELTETPVEPSPSTAVIGELSTKGTTEDTSKIDEYSQETGEFSTFDTVAELSSPVADQLLRDQSEANESVVLSYASTDMDHIESMKDTSGTELSSEKYPYYKIEKHDYSFAQMEEIKTITEANKRLLTPVFLDLMCIKNKDKTLNLILRGSNLINNLKRRLSDSDLLIIRDYLKENKRVVSLDLAFNNITSDGLRNHLIPLLQENRTLKELILSNNEICLQGVEALSEVSSELVLSILRLNGNKLGPKSGEALARLIDESSTLVVLDLSQTDQNVSSLACIAAVLQRNYMPCSVKRYPFCRNPSLEFEVKKKDPKICSPSQLALYVRNLVQQHAIEEGSSLSLSKSEKSRINCPEGIDWTLPMKKIKLNMRTESSESLLVPTIRSQGISETNQSLLNQKCECLKFDETSSSNSDVINSNDSIMDARKPILEALFLDRILGHYHYQPLTYHFARIMSDMLKFNGSIRQLHLQKNSLVDSDVKLLCDGLKENVSLRLLDLSANHIGCLGLSHLADVLPHIPLEALILNHNELSDYGARCLFFKLPETHLRMLDLAHNSISDNGMMDLLYVMKKQPKIIFLCIWGNPFTTVTLQKIKSYLVDGWLLTESLDIQIYEVDDVLRHAWKSSADPYKYYYYQRPSKSFTSSPPPPQSYGKPLDFVHYDRIYSRTMSQYVPKTYLHSPIDNNTCTN